MGCFSSRPKSRKDDIEILRSTARRPADSAVHDNERRKSKSSAVENVEDHSSKGQNDALSFSFKELAVATGNFKEDNLLGEGGFGRVFKGHLDKTQVIAVKQLNLEGSQGNQEFIVEVLMLSQLHHENLVKLIGYCTDGHQRLLVYEYMPMGSLADHLFGVEFGKEPLSWNTRISIAAGAARGLEFLHLRDPPVIYRDLKSANILLNKDFVPKLSDFGLAKVGPVGDNTHVSTRVMGTYGYCAPEYAMSGKLTLKSDIYSFGVMLLELITGRKVIDMTRSREEQNLVSWAIPFMKDKKKSGRLADPFMRGRYPRRCFQYIVAVIDMCLSEEANFRPLISDVVVALEYLCAKSHALEAAGGQSGQLTSPSFQSPSRSSPPQIPDTGNIVLT